MARTRKARDFDELGDPGEGGSEAGDDRDVDSPDDVDPDDEDASNRPDGYSESGDSDEDREQDGDDADEDEDETGDEGDDEEEEFDPRRGKHPSRSLESILRENDRRHRKEKRELLGVITRMTDMQGEISQTLARIGQPAPQQLPEKPPHTAEEIGQLQSEGNHVEAARAQEANADWRTKQLSVSQGAQRQRERDLDKLAAYIEEKGLDLKANPRLAQKVQEEASVLMARIPSLSKQEAILMAKATVNLDSDGGKGNGKRDLRTESRTRERERARAVRSVPDRRSPAGEGTARPVKMTPEIRKGLERTGLLEKYEEGLKSKNPKTRDHYRKAVARVAARLDDVKAETRRGR